MVEAIQSFQSKRLNVLGFLSKDERTFFRHAERPVDTGQAVAAFDASWHTSRAFLDRTGA